MIIQIYFYYKNYIKLLNNLLRNYYNKMIIMIKFHKY